MPQKNQNKRQNDIHRPVLIREVIKYLEPQDGQSFLDLTAGYGGHASEVLRKSKLKNSVLVDRDPYAVDVLHHKFTSDNIQIIHQDFLSAAEELASKNQHFDMILADLGVSSPHFDDANRGFSVSKSGPLDMRMDPRQELTAEFLVNNWDESRIANVLKEYGEEPKAQAIARKIIADRPIRTSKQLAAIASQVWPGRSRVHPATRTFQAIRIAVNDEINQLEKSLPIWKDLLAPGGRLVIISFHSLEDRIVKQFFTEHGGNYFDSELTILTKKPITAGSDEIVSNPRARSAKLRACSKNKNKKKG